MELRKTIYILLIMVLFAPLKVLAGSVTVDLDCPATANKNSEITCKVSATPVGTNLAGIQFNYDFKEVNYQSFTPDKNWAIYSNSVNGVSLGIDASNGKVVVGTLKLKTKTSSATISLTRIQGTNDSYETLNSSNVSKTVRIKSDNNDLQELSIEGVELTPNFDSNITSYTANVDAESIKISGSASNNATIKGLGTFNLKYGDNSFNIEVTSESGLKKIYTIIIKRTDDRNTNNKLKSLTIDNGTINFNTDKTSYNIEVEQNVSEINIKAELDDPKSSFVDKYGPRKVELEYGNNKIEVKVQAENEVVRTYTLNIMRKDERSENANLSNIILSTGAIIFDPDIDTYEITVRNDVKKIDITPEVDDDSIKVEIDNKELEVGLNVITIEVTAEKGNTKTYTINVIRLKPGEGLSDNNNIKKLEIVGHDVLFDIDNRSYTVTITNEKKLVFNIEMEDETATYVIQNNDALDDGSIVKVFAKSESGNIRQYDFYIEKNNQSNIILYVIIATAVLTLGIIVVTFILKKGKKKKKVLIPEEII